MCQPAQAYSARIESGVGGSSALGSSQPLRLVVDRRCHADEIARFEASYVRGPDADDCAIWVGPIGTDGYPRFWVRRGGPDRIMLRGGRYAIALARNGVALEPWERALHGCNNPACVRPSNAADRGLVHVVAGSQQQNMIQMARSGRGGGRKLIQRGGAGIAERRERAVALREAVRHGWDADAVAAALLAQGNHLTLW